MINITFHIYLSQILRMIITRDPGLFLKQDCWKHLLMHKRGKMFLSESELNTFQTGGVW